jgi:crotonobetaine/carnitine-CoA ligase
MMDGDNNNHAVTAGVLPGECWTVPAILKKAVQTFGDKPFLELAGGKCETYQQTAAKVNEFAARLYGLGVRHGHRVLSMLPNSHGAVHTWLAINQLNAVDVGINTGYKGKSLEHAANLSEAQVIVTTASYLEVITRSAENFVHLRTVVLLGDTSINDVSHGKLSVVAYDDLPSTVLQDLPENDAAPWDIGSVIYTSGTSGAAKGVLLPHAQIALLAKRSAEKMDLGPEDVFFSFYPMYHMAGKFMSVLATMVVGGKVVLDSGFVPEQWLSRIKEYGATVTAAHGPMLEMVYALPPSSADRDHALRLIRTAPFPKRIAASFQERYGVRGMEVWGMTEIGIACWSDYRESLHVGSCGYVDKDYFDFAVLDAHDRPVGVGQVGEFALRPKYPWTIMQGYLGMPEKTLEVWRNLWFHTGDCGYVSETGHVYFVDRTKERIRRRAENISAGDIESAMLLHDGVKEAAAVGVNSGYEGDDDILLCIVTKNAVKRDPVELLRFLMAELPHFMMPRFICQVQALPRTATGKLQRTVLKDIFNTNEVWDRKTAGISLRDLVTSQ